MIFKWLNNFFGTPYSTHLDDSEDVCDTSELQCSDIHDYSHESTEINPANGLPMVGGIGGVDVEGNAYGTSSSNDLLSGIGIDSTDFSTNSSHGFESDIGCSSLDTASGFIDSSSDIGCSNTSSDNSWWSASLDDSWTSSSFDDSWSSSSFDD